jgi:hypothetical protein
MDQIGHVYVFGPGYIMGLTVSVNVLLRVDLRRNFKYFSSVFKTISTSLTLFRCILQLA